MPNEYIQALERAKKERVELAEKRKLLETIDQKLRAIDSLILQINAVLAADSPEPAEIPQAETKRIKPDMPLADLIHKVLDELGITSFRIPFMKAEFVKRGWLEDKPSAGLLLRNAALRRKNEFSINNGELSRTNKPHKKPEDFSLLEDMDL
jgi:hypothetical protein